MVAKRGKNSKDTESSNMVEPHELISSSEVEQIRKALIQTHADLVVRGMLDLDVRVQLESIVRKEYNRATKGNKDVIAYVVRETIGTGVIEEILLDESITDIGYNGSELIIESNDRKQIFDTNFEITEAYIVRLVNKFANANNKEFTSKNPIFDGRFENVRINAVHAQNTAPESGTTMSLRVVRPKLALTENNFEGFAPMFIYDLLRTIAQTQANIVISGTTGTGKTELHKLVSSFITFDDRILLIEDTPETFMKEMFPEKDIYSWVTSENVGVTDLIKAGLRNHPTWIMVTETRGSEAYEMIQAVLSGHFIITSLHATDARAIPSRFVNMAKMDYDLSEEALIQDIRRYFDFGIHIKKVKYKGMVVRYLSEIVQFDVDGDKTVFSQRLVNGVFTFETFDLSDDFKDRMIEASVEIDFPVNFKSERPLNPDDVSFESTIPINKDGRPDLEKIEKMGTTLDELMGRDSSQKSQSDSDITYDGFDEESVDVIVDDRTHAERRIDELKKASRRKVRPTPESRTVVDSDDVVALEDTLQNIDDEVMSILDRYDDVDSKVAAVRKPVRKPPVPDGFRDRRTGPVRVPKRVEQEPVAPPVKTVAEILEEKRKMINDGKL